MNWDYVENALMGYECVDGDRPLFLYKFSFSQTSNLS